MYGENPKANLRRQGHRSMVEVIALVSAVMLFIIALNTYNSTAVAADNTPSKQSSTIAAKNDAHNDDQQYLRMVRDQTGEPTALEVAIVRFIRAASPGSAQAAIVVDLIGAVHIAEPEYYDRLNEEFKNYDVVLFEMVAPKDDAIPKKGEGKNRHPVAAIQNMMTWMLDLEYQLDGIDYTAKNFVHADMSPKQFRQSMQDRGESFFAIFLRAIGYSMTKPSASGSGINNAELLATLFDQNRSLALKRLMARQFQDMGGALAIFNGPNGSTLITERNRVALEELGQQIAAGRKKAAIFYGAGHMPDMAKRLEEDFGMHRGGARWLQVWNLSAE